MPETITQTSAPWGPLQEPLQFGFQQARSLYDQGGPQYYPQSTVAQFGQDTTGALDMFRQQAQAGTPVAGAAGQQVTNTLQGDYLNSNPYLDAMYNSAAQNVTRYYQDAVQPGLAATFSLAGGGGQNAMANAFDSSRDRLGDTLGNLASNIYGNNYQQERGRMMQAAALAPQTANLGYFDANQMLNVGQLMDDKSQQNVTDQFNRHMFNQERPYDNLGRYMGFLGGRYGQETSSPVNSMAQNLGLGLAGVGLVDEILGSTSYGGLGGFLGSLF